VVVSFSGVKCIRSIRLGWLTLNFLMHLRSVLAAR
jgi:hypothetical protein